MPKRADSLTLPDLVVLSMLCERPMHGYELNVELERRMVEDWAAVSRPQVYYSLKKLAAARFIASVDGEASLGPERNVFRPTPAGRHALADALAREEWATQRPPPPFLTWLVLSWQARPADAAALIARRREFLQHELATERAALAAIIAETSPNSDAAMIVTLTIRQFELELDWLRQVAKRQRPAP
ncbi:MAG: PadR family transcriptional regulator [Gemmatimonadota bacterium]|nr:PadR family transcriptional regulator [Gemmatimonadota bacterium]